MISTEFYVFDIRVRLILQSCTQIWIANIHFELAVYRIWRKRNRKLAIQWWWWCNPPEKSLDPFHNTEALFFISDNHLNLQVNERAQPKFIKYTEKAVRVCFDFATVEVDGIKTRYGKH